MRASAQWFDHGSISTGMELPDPYIHIVTFIKSTLWILANGALQVKMQGDLGIIVLWSCVNTVCFPEVAGLRFGVVAEGAAGVEIRGHGSGSSTMDWRINTRKFLALTKLRPLQNYPCEPRSWHLIGSLGRGKLGNKNCLKNGQK